MDMTQTTDTTARESFSDEYRCARSRAAVAERRGAARPSTVELVAIAVAAMATTECVGCWV